MDQELNAVLRLVLISQCNILFLAKRAKTGRLIGRNSIIIICGDGSMNLRWTCLRSELDDSLEEASVLNHGWTISGTFTLERGQGRAGRAPGKEGQTSKH